MPRSLGVSAVLCLLLATTVSATPYAGEFMAAGIGARALGLGGAFVALVDDASATYWNPAALPRNQRRQVMYMHTERFGDLVNTDSGALVFRTRESASGARSAFGLGLVMLSVPNILFTTTDPDILEMIEIGNEGTPLDGDGILQDNERVDLALLSEHVTEVTDRQMGFILSYGRSQAIVNSLSLGGSLKVVRKSVDDYSAWGLGLDIGALFRMTDHLALGLNLQDITTTFLDWSNTPTGEREYITPTVKIGAAYTRPISFLAGAIAVAVDGDFRFEDEVDTTFQVGSATGDVRAGIEYKYRDTIAFRVGNERLGSDLNLFTVGAGLYIKAFSFDYAYRNHSDLDDTHRISGGVVF